MTHQQKHVRFIGLIGRPGSGKGIASDQLQRDIPNSIIARFGSIIRASVDPNHPYHELCADLRAPADDGLLPPIEKISPLMQQVLDDCIEGGYTTIIGDALPRLPEAVGFLEAFKQRLSQTGIAFEDCYVYFFAPEAITQERLEKRRLVEQRVDDGTHLADIRRNQFESLTWEATREVARLNRLLVVDARGTAEEVYGNLRLELNRVMPREIYDAFQELRGWTDSEENIPTVNYESRMERR